MCCVVKANAYGCGVVVVAKYLEKQNIDFYQLLAIEHNISTTTYKN
ncbi:hypothetical protein [Terrisporobacter sp.]